MSLKNKDLSVLAYANGFTLWHYVTEDSIPLMENYFDCVSDMVRSGDMIMVNTKNFSGIIVVKSNNSGEVRMSNMTRTAK